MFNKILFLFMLGISVQTFAQVKQATRLELDEKDDVSGKVSAMGNHGFLAHGWGAKINGIQDYHLAHYSTDLNLLRREQVKVPKGFNLEHYVVASDNSKIALLFIDPKPNKNFFLVTYFSDGKLIKLEGQLPEGIIVKQVLLFENSLFIRGVHNKPMLLNMDVRTGNYIELNETDETLTYYAMELLPENKLVIVPYILGKKLSDELFFLFYDEKGGKKFEVFRIKFDPGKLPLNGSVTFLSPDHFIVVGSFSNDADYFACGIYVADVYNGEVKYIKYHLFADMKNFFSYLSNDKREQAEKKVERKSKRGKEDALDVLISPHSVFEHGGNYVFIGEAYYTTYRQEPTYHTYRNGNSFTSYHYVFDGYQYTHAVIAIMSPSGETLWDHCIPMWLDYKPYKPTRNLRVLINGDEIQVLFSTGGYVNSVVVKGKEMSEKSYERLDGMTLGDKTKSTGVTKTEYWYDNYFLSYGWQTIKNTGGKGIKKRKVFFVSKIEFQSKE